MEFSSYKSDLLLELPNIKDQYDVKINEFNTKINLMTIHHNEEINKYVGICESKDLELQFNRKKVYYF